MAGEYKRRPVPLRPSLRDENGDKIIQPYVPETILSKDTVKSMLPKGSSITVSSEVMDIINNMEHDTGLPQDVLEESFKEYSHILENGSISLKSYANAIKFCSLARHHNNSKSWEMVFPERAHRLKEMGKESEIVKHAAEYFGTKTVRAVHKDMLIPTYLKYSGYHHAAIEKQFQLLNGKSATGAPVSAMVEHLAAKELAVLTAQPVEMTLNVKTSPSDAAISAQFEMNEQLKMLVAGQKAKLQEGQDIIDVQAIGLDFADIGMNNE